MAASISFAAGQCVLDVVTFDLVKRVGKELFRNSYSSAALFAAVALSCCVGRWCSGGLSRRQDPRHNEQCT